MPVEGQDLGCGKNETSGGTPGIPNTGKEQEEKGW